MIEELNSGLINGARMSLLGRLFPELFPFAHDPAGSVSAHRSDSGWDIKVSKLIQVELAAKREELM